MNGVSLILYPKPSPSLQMMHIYIVYSSLILCPYSSKYAYIGIKRTLFLFLFGTISGSVQETKWDSEGQTQDGHVLNKHPSLYFRSGSH